MAKEKEKNPFCDLSDKDLQSIHRALLKTKNTNGEQLKLVEQGLETRASKKSS